jgi:hypothetical protein
MGHVVFYTDPVQNSIMGTPTLRAPRKGSRERLGSTFDGDHCDYISPPDECLRGSATSQADKLQRSKQI